MNWHCKNKMFNIDICKKIIIVPTYTHVNVVLFTYVYSSSSILYLRTIYR